MKTIPHTGKPVETGTIRFTGQRPGIYIDNNEAHYLANCLEGALSGGIDNALTRGALESALELLRSAGKPERPTLDLFGEVA